MKVKSYVLFGVGTLFLLTLAGVGLGHSFASQSELEYVRRTKVNGEFVNAQSFEDVLQNYKESSVDFLSSEWEWNGESFTMAELGVSIDLALLHELDGFMEDASALQKAIVFLQGQRFQVPIQVDEAFLEAQLTRAGLLYEAQNARYGFADEAFTIIPQEDGYSLDTASMTAQLQQLWLEPNPRAMDLPRITETPAITTADLESHLDAAKALAEKRLVLQDEYGEEWGFILADHVDWFEPEGEGMTLNKEAFALHAKSFWGPEVEAERQDVVITTDENGNHQFEGTARFGKSINTDALYEKVIAELAKEERQSILFPLDLEQPDVSVPKELEELGVTDLVGFGYSNFSGSPYNRVHNINVGMNIFDGLLIAPGEEFSFTTLMGPIDAAHGWKPELVILGDETKPEYGGGLCQVSSTMFRAALYSGLPITARRNHSYAVSYYAYPSGYGLDATIYDPYPDFRFLNDTQGHLLVQGYIEGSSAYFVLYGSYDDRRVKMEGPVSYGYHSISEPQVTYTDELAPGERVLDSYAHTGFKTDWWRTIYYADGTESERENYHSNYEARPTKYLEGKVESGPGDAPGI